MPFLRLDGNPLDAAIVDLGRSGVVILHCKHNVLKIPKVYRDPNATPDEAEIEEILAEQNYEFLENEKRVYQRLGHHDGVVSWVNLSEDGIEMAYMKKGPLSRYLQTETPPDRLVAQWIPALAKTISYAHSRNVIIGDIASRNVLLGDDMSVKLCDFTDSALMPPDSDMSQAEDNGASIKTDMFQFGSLAYEMLTRKPFKYDSFARGVENQGESNRGGDWEPGDEWPPAECLPSTQHLVFGQIIFKCWTNGYQNMEEVCGAVEQALNVLSESGRKTHKKT